MIQGNNKEIPCLSSRKKIKRELLPNDTNWNGICLSKHTSIKPLIYNRTQSPSHIEKKYANKLFSKILVSGQNTLTTLEKVQKSPYIRFVGSFEFDPYLCDESGIKPLSKILKKLKLTKSLNLVIRRVKKINESDSIAPYIHRILRMKKLRIEFPSTLNVDKHGIRSISLSLAKCQSLKELEVHLITMPHLSQSMIAEFIKRLRKISQIEKLTLKTWPIYSVKNEFTDMKMHFPILPKLKTFHYTQGAQNGWTCLTGDSGEFLSFYIHSFAKAINPVSFYYRFDGYVVTTEAILALIEVLPKFSKLRHFTLEIDYCKLSEFDVMLFGDGISKCTQIEHLTFKFIQ